MNGCYGMMAPGEGCTVSLEVWGTRRSLGCGSTMPGTWIWTTSLLRTPSSLCTGGVCRLHLHQLLSWEGVGPTDGAWHCTRVPDPRTSPQGCVHPPPVPGAGAEPWACSVHPFCVCCPKRVAVSPSPSWHLRTPLSYLGSSRAPDVWSSPAWQIPKAGGAIPAHPGQILLRSCLSCATRRWQAAYQMLDLREKGATWLGGERLHGDAGDGLQATAAGASSCHSGVSSPKYRSYLGEALMEKLFRKASAGILEEPPGPAGRGMLWWGSQGAPTKAPQCCPCQSQHPCQGRARGKQAPARAAIPPAYSLPSLLPLPPGPASLGRAGCSGCQNARGAMCRGMQATLSLPYSLLIFELYLLPCFFN